MFGIIKNKMKTYIPNKEHRTNPLSKTEGGSTVKVVKKNKTDNNMYEIIYENIKYPNAYINKLKDQDLDIVQIFINEKEAWSINSK